MKDIILEKHGILTKVDHSVKVDGFISTWEKIGKAISNSIDWCQHFKTNIAQISVDFLAEIYGLLMLVLQTPLFIFNNSYLQDATLTFSGISILIVVILTMVEGIKRMFKKSKTNVENISKRFSIAAVGSGFAPFLFEKTFALLNWSSKAITQIGSTEIKSQDAMSMLKLNGFDTLALIGFDAIVLALMIPLILQNGRRFFDLMCLSAITPLALSAWVFPDHKHYFNRWWTNVKKLASVQLVYSIFICIMGIFIFGTRNIVDGGGLLLKIIIIIGGLYRMSNPPGFVKSMVDQGEDIEDVGSNMKKTFHSIYDTITLKKSKIARMLKNKLFTSK